MRRGSRLSCLVGAQAFWAALSGAAVAQDAPPGDIGTGIVEIAGDALSAAPDPEVRQFADERPFVAVPHPDGSTEIFPLTAGAEATALEPGASAPATQPVPHGGALPGSTVAEAASTGADAVTATAQAASGATTESGKALESDIAAADRPDPLEMLQRFWREAVASGDTSEGFEDWLRVTLNPEPEAPGQPASQASLTREVAAAWDRRTGPVTLGQAGRVVTTFGEAIPTAFCSPLTVCLIELEPGEQLTDTPSWGDTVRWQVVPKRQGRDPETVVLEIKPAVDAVETNLVIPTDRRLYTIALRNDPEFHTPILSFRWPDSEARAIAESIERQRAEERAAEEAREAEAAALADVTAAEMAHSGVPTESGPRTAELLDFRFKVDGKAAFRPVRVFADGSRTYIDFHPRYRGPLPAIVAGKAEGNAALNTRVSASGSRLVADRVITDVWLQSGRERVRIRRIAN